MEVGKKWSEANEACRKLRGILARIKDKATQNVIVERIKSNDNLKGNYWIGGVWNRSASAQFKWVTGELKILQIVILIM